MSQYRDNVVLSMLRALASPGSAKVTSSWQTPPQGGQGQRQQRVYAGRTRNTVVLVRHGFQNIEWSAASRLMGWQQRETNHYSGCFRTVARIDFNRP